MDVNNRRLRAETRAGAVSGFYAGDVAGVDAGAVAGDVDGAVAGVVESAYRWNQLPPDRQMIVNKIMETLHRHLSVSGQEGLQELNKTAMMFEENIYTAATSRQDYLRQISLKMLTLENKSQNPMTNYLHPVAASSGQNAHGPDQWNLIWPEIEMDGNNWRAGAAAGAMDSGDWRTQLLPDSRQRIVNKIMETLHRHLSVSGQEGLQELNKIAIMFEEKIYTAATSRQDYLRQIGLKKLALLNKSQNPMTNYLHPIAASSGQNAHGPERNLIWSEIGNNWRAGGAVGAMDSGDWRTQLLPDSRQRIVNRIMETLQRHLPVSSQEGVQELMKIVVRFEEKIYTAATSQADYLRKISLKMLTLETKSRNTLTNGPEMTIEATSYETISGPEESNEEAEEDDDDVSKEDGLEEVVVTEEQKSAVGHKENVKVGENEISCGLNSGAKIDERLAQVEERLEKMEARSEKVETLLVDINKKLNYLVKMQDAKVSRDIKRPAKYRGSLWTGNDRLKRKHKVADMIRQSCKHRRLGRGAIAQ